MDGRFTLSIKLGNEAMSTRQDVAGALEQVIRKLGGCSDGGRIMDVNGNCVGTWDLDAQEDDE